MILFLDFDGVTHPEPCPDADLFCLVSFVWQILRACPTVDVVFSTSWKATQPVDELVSFVTHGGGEDLAHRFVGATPSIVREEGANYTGKFFRREVECRLWMADNGRGRAWLAVDDFAPYFSPSCQQLYLVDKSTGLTGADVQQVVACILSTESVDNRQGLSSRN